MAIATVCHRGRAGEDERRIVLRFSRRWRLDENHRWGPLAWLIYARRSSNVQVEWHPYPRPLTAAQLASSVSPGSALELERWCREMQHTENKIKFVTTVYFWVEITQSASRSRHTLARQQLTLKTNFLNNNNNRRFWGYYR